MLSGPRVGRTAAVLMGTLLMLSAVQTAARSDWRLLRDADIERQSLDYSCGAAALATLLRWYGVEAIDEAGLLEAHYAQVGHPVFSQSEVTDLSAWYLSLADLSALAGQWGLRAYGVAVAAERLWDLQLPAIAHLAGLKQPHFVLIQGLDASGRRVALADPAGGHRYLSAAAFYQEWLPSQAPAMGRLLLLEPLGSDGEAALRQRFAEHRFRDLPLQYLLPALR